LNSLYPESVQDLIEGDITDVCLDDQQTNCITFINWRNVPFTRPEVINVGGVQTIEWPLFTGG